MDLIDPLPPIPPNAWELGLSDPGETTDLHRPSPASERSQRAALDPYSIPPYAIGVHTVENKKKLIARVRRIRGQLEAVERALEGEAGCSEVLQTVTSARGALNGLVGELIEGHIRTHVIDGERATAPQREAAEELVQIVRAYVK
ncbi:metal/formaldehyde-sensitive transcriptional repressor [Sorangium sp. So ce327]